MLKSRSRVLLVAAGVAVAALALAGVAGAEEEVVETRPAPDPVASSADRPAELSGTFSVQFVDPRPGSDREHKVQYVLTDDRGESTELLLGEVGRPPEDPLALAGEQVTVTGEGLGGDRLQVQTIEPAQGMSALEASAAAVTGSRPTATILCRFSDLSGFTPRSRSYFQTLMSNTYPGLDHFWRQVSYGNIDLSGSRVFGWYNLPHPRSHYAGDGGLPTDADLRKAAADCRSAADADVFFPDYTNLNFMFNWEFNYAMGDPAQPITRDGQTRTYGVTYNPPYAFNNQTVLAHEMGHSFGLPHSGGLYGRTYDSEWDPMSSVRLRPRSSPFESRDVCLRGEHSVYGCVAVHTISYHKDRQGWIPPERKYTATAGPDQDISLERLGRPASNDNYLMAQIPIGDSATFYTVEARRFAGYDGNVPGEGIVIHRVNGAPDPEFLEPRAKVIDPDRNGNPNDAGAIFTPGETFEDRANGISVEITGVSSGVYDVRISTPTQALADTTNPNVWFQNPGGQPTIGGSNFVVAARAVDDRAMDRVEFFVDGTSVVGTYIGTDTTGSYYAVFWDSATMAEGSTVTLTARAYDAAGNIRTARSFSERIDNTPPEFESVFPSDGQTKVKRNTSVTATFVEDMAFSSLNEWSVVLYRRGTTTPVPARVGCTAWPCRTVKLDPSVRLLARNTTYEVYVMGGAAGALDQARNPVAPEGLARSWSFTTGRR